MKDVLTTQTRLLKLKMMGSNITILKTLKGLEKDETSRSYRLLDIQVGKLIKNSPLSIHKYMNIDFAIRCLDEGIIRFSQPTEWQDKYEARFYEANYGDVAKDPSVTPRFLACCFTTNAMSEASWNTYKYGKQGFGRGCVKFKLSRTQIRENILNDKCITNVYEGYMNYSVPNDVILKLHKRNSGFYDEIFGEGKFSLQNYLSLMMIKRQAFYYEGEYRFMITKKQTGDKPLERTYDIKMDWASAIEDVEVDDDCTYLEMNILKDSLLNAGIKKELVDDVHKVNLYKDLSEQPIKIEKNNNAKNSVP